MRALARLVTGRVLSSGLLVKMRMIITVIAVMVVMTVMGRYFHHDLRLHRIR
jgi:hypothetical protein